MKRGAGDGSSQPRSESRFKSVRLIRERCVRLARRHSIRMCARSCRAHGRSRRARDQVGAEWSMWGSKVAATLSTVASSYFLPTI
jgi:hypothetical protein